MTRNKNRGKARPKKPKRLPVQALRGQKGVNLLEKIVLDMGSTWTPTGSLEVGIDGYIELYDPSTGEALGSIVAAQSKAQTTLANETVDGFDYWCDQRDVDYWMRGNMPIILVVSQPTTGDAFWIPVKDYFSRPENASSTRVHFSKKLNALTPSSIRDLLALGRAAEAGLYLAPLPRVEQLHSNLLALAEWPSRLWIAETLCRSPGEIWAALRQSKAGVDGAWLLREKRIFSFHDLGEEPWASVCEVGSCESFDTTEWSDSDDADRQRQFVQLLNQTLRAQVSPEIRYWADQDCYAFVGTPEKGSQKVGYRSLKRGSTLTAVAKYSKKIDNRTFVWLRHLAFRGQFRRLDGQWYLEITPTYRFTWDGYRLDRFHEERLKTIKRFEGNRAVLSALLFWADKLKPRQDLFNNVRAPLQFGELLRFACEVGIDDKRWSAVDPAPPRDTEESLAQTLLLPDIGAEVGR